MLYFCIDLDGFPSISFFMGLQGVYHIWLNRFVLQKKYDEKLDEEVMSFTK